MLHAVTDTYPVLIRRSASGDRAALEQLAALDSRPLPAGAFLLAEVRDELVAAASLTADDEPMADPFRRTAEIRDWLRQQAAALRAAA